MLKGPLPYRPQARPAALWSMGVPTGEDYRVTLERLHATFRPRTYLEIGVADGATLALAACASIGIDPAFGLSHDVVAGKPACLLFQAESDTFFDRQDPVALLGGRLEMSFLDGMHLFEFLLRDFINVERHSVPESLVLLHDCLPIDEHVARRDAADTSLAERSGKLDWWAGDVWKTLFLLLRERRDLRIAVLDAASTGLVAITGLDPGSTLLRDRYDELVATYGAITLASHGEAFLGSFARIDPARFADDPSLRLPRR